MSLSSDPTKAALRAALDAQYRAFAGNIPEHVSDCLGSVILRCLPQDIVYPVFTSADRARRPSLAIAFKPTFRSYVAYATEYWAALVLGHGNPAPDREKQTVA